MNRRMMLVAAAAVATTGPAFAQNSSAAPPPASGPAPQLSQAEQDYINNTAKIGTASLQMSDIALQKARHPRVKEFARFEHDEQTTMGDVLKSMNPNLKPPAPPQEVAAAIEKLKQLRPGEAFDSEFVTAQIQGHEALRTTQQGYLKSARNPEAITAAKLALAMINEHLALLSDLRRDRLARL